MNLLQRTVLVVGLVALVGAACWQYRAALAARREAAPPPDVCVLAGPSDASLAIEARMTRKVQATHLLIAGELTLLETAAYFRELNDNPPEHRCDFRRLMPGASDGEKACRQVISWARTVLDQYPYPDVSAEIIERLERELEELMAGNKEVELPW